MSSPPPECQVRHVPTFDLVVIDEPGYVPLRPLSYYLYNPDFGIIKSIFHVKVKEAHRNTRFILRMNPMMSVIVGLELNARSKSYEPVMGLSDIDANLFGMRMVWTESIPYGQIHLQPPDSAPIVLEMDPYRPVLDFVHAHFAESSMSPSLSFQDSKSEPSAQSQPSR